MDALFLDLDGTMVDIAPRPDEVRAPRCLIHSLEMLFERLGGALAVISGRPIAAIDAVLAPLRLPAAGIHGAEIRFDAREERPQCMAPPITAAVRWMLAPLASIPGVLVEDKTVAIAVHYRQNPEAVERVREVVMAAAGAGRAEGVTVISGKCAFEIKPAGISKGTAIAEFMSRPPWTGHRPVFVGDDVTDEAAFAELPRWGGLGLAVGESRPGAIVRFATAADVRAWLASLVEQECTT
jgi:trehalose 6-phosphate phosphatase